MGLGWFHNSRHRVETRTPLGSVISTWGCAFLHEWRRAICLLEAFHHLCWLVITRDAEDENPGSPKSDLSFMRLKSRCRQGWFFPEAGEDQVSHPPLHPVPGPPASFTARPWGQLQSPQCNISTPPPFRPSASSCFSS